MSSTQQTVESHIVTGANLFVNSTISQCMELSNDINNVNIIDIIRHRDKHALIGWGEGGFSTPPTFNRYSPYSDAFHFSKTRLFSEALGSDPLPRLDHINGPERYTATFANMAIEACAESFSTSVFTGQRRTDEPR